MENPNLLRKKWLAVLKAAVWGAAIAEAMLLATNLVYKIGGPLKELAFGFAMLLAIPAGMLSSNNALANGFVINGLLGAISFALVALFWQFVMKNSED